MNFLKYIYHYIFLLVILLSWQNLIGQSSCAQNITLAKTFYEEGQLERVISLSEDSCSNNEKIELLRLQAEAYAALSELEKAKQKIETILQINKIFKPEFKDSKRFKKLYDAIKRQHKEDITYTISKSIDSLSIGGANIKVITSAEMEQRGYRSLNDLFQDIAGISLTEGYGNTFLYNRGIRNIKETEGVLILIDGVEDNKIWLQSINISDQYALTNIEQIEILDGPQSTFYGANALTMVINIITKKATNILPHQETIGVIGQVTQQISFDEVGLARNSTIADATIMMDLGSQSILTFNGKYAELDRSNLLTNEPYEPKSKAFYGFLYGTSLTDQELEALQDSDRTAYNNSSIASRYKPHQYANFSISLDIENFKIGANFQDIQNETTAIFGDRRNFGIMNSAYHDEVGGFYIKFNKFVANNFYINAASSYRLENSEAYQTRLLSIQSFDIALGDNYTLQEQTYQQQSQEFRTEVNMEYTGVSWMNLIAGMDYRNSLLQGNYQLDKGLNNYHFFNTSLDMLNYSFQQNNHYNIAPYAGLNIHQDYIKGLYLSLGVRYDGYFKTLNNYDFGDDAYYNNFLTLYQRYYGTFSDKNEQFNAYGDTTFLRTNIYNKAINGIRFILSPKFTIVYDALQGRNSDERLVFKLLFNQGFQTTAQAVRFGSTPDVILNNPFIAEPTIAINREININYQRKNVQLSAVYYNVKYNNVLTTRLHPDAYIDSFQIDFTLYESGRNGGIYNGLLVYDYEDIRTQGFQLDGKVTIPIQENSELDIFANYAYTDSKNELEESIAGIAKHQFNVGANWLTLNERLNINVRMNYVGDRSLEAEGYTGLPLSPTTSIPAYTVFHGAVTYYLPRQHLGFQLIARNLFNTTYHHTGIGAADDIYYKARIQQPSRSFYLKLIFDLNRFDVFHRPIF